MPCTQIISKSPSPDPGLWKNCLPRNQSLVPERLGTTSVNGQGIELNQPSESSVGGLLAGGE